MNNNLGTRRIDENRREILRVSNLSDYYELAENKEYMEVFWGESSSFYNRFQTLNLENTIELACGRGRHVPYYYDLAGKITLIDALEKNISFCKNRFADIDKENKISYHTNNGRDLQALSSECFTSVFSYDAMVHFEMMDVFSYLCETERVLSKKGKALFHHSNNHSDYKADFSSSPHGRNYMSAELFAYLAFRAGLEVEDQLVIDWGSGNCFYRKWDCITLLSKE